MSIAYPELRSDPYMRRIQGPSEADMMTLGSLFSGIGGFDLAAERCGIRVAWQSEIDRHASAVLAKHWPDVPNHGDITQMHGGEIEPVDVITGGFPCQDLSVAGRRDGLAGERSGLFFEIIRLIHEMREATDGRYPAIVVFENVPGLLSSNAGEDFSRVLWEVRECGAHDIGWRVLDAQHFGVPQRRRRVFIVGDFGGQRSQQILFEPEGSERDYPPCREAGQDVAGTLESRTTAGGFPGIDGAVAGHVVPTYGIVDDETSDTNIMPTLNMAERGGKPAVAHAVTTHMAKGGDPTTDNYVTVFAQNQRDEVRDLGGVAGSLAAEPGMKQQTYINTPMAVRRLTPRECERLQGFPDDHTRHGADGTEMSDSARYRMCGNAVAVPVVEWLLSRIAEKVRLNGTIE